MRAPILRPYHDGALCRDELQNNQTPAAAARPLDDRPLKSSPLIVTYLHNPRQLQYADRSWPCRHGASTATRTSNDTGADAVAPPGADADVRLRACRAAFSTLGESNTGDSGPTTRRRYYSCPSSNSSASARLSTSSVQISVSQHALSPRDGPSFGASFPCFPGRTSGYALVTRSGHTRLILDRRGDPS